MGVMPKYLVHGGNYDGATGEWICTKCGAWNGPADDDEEDTGCSCTFDDDDYGDWLYEQRRDKERDEQC